VHNLLPILLSKLLSLLQATTLRERYYLALTRIELLDTAIDDIVRISESTVDPHERIRLIKGICHRVRRE
jgi:hypothetical protein